MALWGQERWEQRTGAMVAFGGSNTVTQTAGAGGKPPLIPPFSAGVDDQGDDDGDGRRRAKSPLGSLRASERSVRLIGRDEALELSGAWRDQPASDGGLDHRVLVVHGPGGAGKTRLAAEILQAAREAGWLAGFLSESFRVYQHLPQLTHPSEPTMVAVDYAEARHTDLRRLFSEAPVGHDGEAPFRAILIVREGTAQPNAWLHRLEGDNDLGSRAERLLAPEQLTVVSLDESLPAVADREALWEAAGEGYANGPGAAPPYMGDDLFERPLFVLLDAHRVHSEAGSRESAPPTEHSLFKSVLKHERRYWASAAEEMKLELTERRMNQVAAVATLVGGVARTAFEAALKALDWLRDDEDLLLQVCDWWCSVYETGAGGIRGVEPDIVGEHLVMRALGPREDSRSKLDGSLQVDKLRSLIGLATPAGRQRLLRVLTRIASSGSSGGAESARAVLTELLDLHLQDFLPATFTQAATGFDRTDPGEPLAMTVAAAVLACDRLQLVAAAPSSAELGDGEEGTGSAAIRMTAIGIVRRQIESVAKRELESGRWSVDRFADVMTWALRFDLEAGEHDRALQELRQIEQLDPPPHMALAAMRREIGRHHMATFRGEHARQMFEAALDDLDTAGERDSALGYVILNQLGDALQHEERLAEATRVHEEAFEGLRAAEGLGSDNTIAALTGLAYCLGATDLDDALARRDAALEELGKTDADEQTVSQVRGVSVSAKLAAGRSATASGDFDLARNLLESALDELEAEGERDSLSAYVIVETLAAVAAGGGDRRRAAEFYSETLDGKRRLRDGYDDQGTIGTLLNMAVNLAYLELDRAVAVLDEVAAELRDAGSERCESVVSAQAGLLNRAGRLSEGFAVIRGHHQATLVRDVRQAVFDTIADSVPRESILPFAVAADGVLLAAELFDVGDPRLLSLASRLGLLALERATAAFGRQISDATLETINEDPESIREDIRDLAGSLQMPDLKRDVPTVAKALADVRQGIRAALVELRAEPAVADAGIAGPHDAAVLIEADEVRRWLVRCGFEGPAMQGLDAGAAAVGGILAWSLSAHSGMLEAPSLAGYAMAIWRGGGPDPELVAVEEARLRAELSTLTSVEGDGEGFVGMGKASGLLCAAGMALNDGEPDEGEELCRAALEALEAVGQADNGLAWSAREQMSGIAASEGELAKAISHAEAAVEGWRRLEGEPIGASTVSAMVRLADYRAQLNFDQALTDIDAAIEELERADADAPALIRLRRGRVTTVRSAGSRAFRAGDVERAEELYREAHEELVAIGEKDSTLALSMLNDLGIAALRRGDRQRGVELLERALDGWRPLVGPADTRTQLTLSALAHAISEDDPKAGLTLLDAGLEECLESGTEGNDLTTLRQARARVLHQLGEREFDAGRKVERAGKLFGEVLDELSAIGEGESSLAYVALHSLGNVAISEDDAAAALDLYRKAMEGKRELRGVAHPDTLVSVAAFAECQAMTNVDEAMAVVDKVLVELSEEEMAEADLMPLEFARATICRLGGEMAVNEGELDDAERLFERALATLDSIGQSNTASRYGLVARLALVAAARDELEPATKLYREAYEGLRQVPGVVDADTSSVLVQLAHVVSRTDPDAGEDVLAEAITELAEARAPADRIADLRRALAGLLLRNARLLDGGEDDAEARLRRALEELTAAGEEDSLAAYVTLHDLGNVTVNRGDDSAIELYRQALKGKRKLLGFAHRETIVTLKAMAEVQAASDYEGAVQILEEAVEELAVLDAPSELSGLLRDALARVHLLGGRRAEAAGDLDEAERIYGRALAEVAEGDGSGDLDLANVLNHDLANVATKRQDPERAIGLYREAFEGKRRLRGPADVETVGTLLSLSNVLARSNLPAALALFDEALEELDQTEGAERLAEIVREGRTVAYLHAGREAEAAGRLDDAEERYRDVLEDLEKRGARDHLLSYVVLHDLGDVAAGRDEHRQAASHYRAAFDGKRRLEGLAAVDTMSTFLRLSEALGVDDPPAAAELTSDVLSDLRPERDVDERAVAFARRARATALLGFGFHSLRADELSVARDCYDEMLELVDTADETDGMLRFGAVAGLGELAEREGNAERAAELYREAYETMRRQGAATDQIATEYLFRLVVALTPIEPEAALELIDEALPEFEREERTSVAQNLRSIRVGALVGVARKVLETDLGLAERRFRKTLDELAALGMDEPEAVSVITHELGGIAIRRGEHGRAAELFEEALSGKRRAGGIADESAILSLGGLVEALLPTNPMRAVELLDDSIEELNASDADVEMLEGVRRMRAIAVMLVGRKATELEDWKEAESCLLRSLEEVAEIGQDQSLLAAVITHDLGDVAMGRHEFEQAAELYGSALERKRQEVGLANEDTLVTLQSLAFAKATADLPTALAMLDEVLDELGDSEDVEHLVNLVRDNRPAVYLHAGRAAEEATDLDQAERHYKAVLEELEARGARESILAYVALHDLGDVALARDDAGAAVPLFEEALRGKRRLESPGSRNVITTLLRLADALVPEDPAAAFTMLEGAAEQLTEEGAGWAVARIEEWLKGQQPPAADDSQHP